MIGEGARHVCSVSGRECVRAQTRASHPAARLDDLVALPREDTQPTFDRAAAALAVAALNLIELNEAFAVLRAAQRLRRAREGRSG
jgi:hypothetical protein